MQRDDERRSPRSGHDDDLPAGEAIERALEHRTGSVALGALRGLVRDEQTARAMAGALSRLLKEQR